MQEVCGLSQTLKAETYIHPSVAHYRYHINFQIRWISFGSLELSNNKFFVTSKELSFAGTLLQTPQKLQTIERWRLECSTEKKMGNEPDIFFNAFIFMLEWAKEEIFRRYTEKHTFIHLLPRFLRSCYTDQLWRNRGSSFFGLPCPKLNTVSLRAPEQFR